MAVSRWPDSAVFQNLLLQFKKGVWVIPGEGMAKVACLVLLLGSRIGLHTDIVERMVWLIDNWLTGP